MQRRRKGKSLSKAKKKTIDGIEFASGLEAFCYTKLKEANIPSIYQPESMIVFEGFKAEFPCYENMGVIRRDKDHKIIHSTKRFDTTQTVRKIEYTPDFKCPDDSWIIETKGYANEAFPLRWKLVKRYLTDIGFTGVLMKPTNQEEVLKCIEIIKELKNE